MESNQCGCVACLRGLPDDGNPIPHDRRWMVLCPICRNKRCPHAEDHIFACTGSNKPNQSPRLLADDEQLPEPSKVLTIPEQLSVLQADNLALAEENAKLKDENERLKSEMTNSQLHNVYE